MAKKGENKDREEVNDSRFSTKLSRPIFNKSSHSKNKVVLDDRFKGMLTDERFLVLPGQSVDAYGREKKKTSGANELKKYYKMDIDDAQEHDDEDDEDDDDSEEDSAEEEEKVSSKKTQKKAPKKSKESPSSEEDEEDEEDEEGEEDRLDYLTRLARGEIAESGSDSSDESQVEEEEEIEEEEIEYGEATTRLSVLNCDWENIRAVDLMVICQSFCPPGSLVKNVTVYPSDFGLLQMEEEARFGPQGIWKKLAEEEKAAQGWVSADDNSEEGSESEGSESQGSESQGSEAEGSEAEGSEAEEDEGSEEEETDPDFNKKFYGDFQRKKNNVGLVIEGQQQKKKKKSSDFDEQALRRYELSKLKYYFAVVEMDSVASANILYEELDDIEFEASSMALELRFIPDDMDFSGRQIRDSCSKVPENYKAPDSFVIGALQNSNFECTWDQGDKKREKLLSGVSSWRSLKDDDLMQYIASGSEEEDDEEHLNGEMDDDNMSVYSTLSKKEQKKLKKKKAKELRKKLLGEAAGDGSEDETGNFDSFFNEEAGEEDVEGNLSMSFVPEEDKKSKKSSDKKQSKQSEELSPYEIELAKMAQKKKAKKEAKKALKEALESGITREEFFAEKNENKRKLEEVDPENDKKKIKREKGFEALFGKNDKNMEELDEEKRKIQLEILMNNDEDSGEENDTYRKAKNQKFSKKNKKMALKIQQDEEKKKEKEKSFTVNLGDERFSKVFDGDSAFGIDLTSNEYKESENMKKILHEQRKRRMLKEKKAAISGSAPAATSAPADSEKKNQGQSVDNLVNRLKMKFKK